MRVRVRFKVFTIILDGRTESIVCISHKEEISGLGFGSGLVNRICCGL